jgi:Prolyl oligopeptidase, N-terminal beta-propeller domain
MASFPGGYPAARRLDLVEDLHGYRVADPYRWLEDADSPETRQWLAAEDELWAGYRAGLPRGDEFAARVRELLRVGSVGLPTWRGPTRFGMRRDPDQEHAVLYVSDHEISGMSGAPFAPDIPEHDGGGERLPRGGRRGAEMGGRGETARPFGLMGLFF